MTSQVEQRLASLGLQVPDVVPPVAAYVPAVRHGDLVFTSANPHFSSEELTDFHTTSRTFSVYYPDTRPGSDRYTVVVSINSRYADWNSLSEEEYARHKQRLIDESLAALEKYIPGVRAKIDWMEAATPRTVERYTTHFGGTSFGTKFEGLKV